jgi:D-alanine--poly(phosphoribitol) ligase subunit 1
VLRKRFVKMKNILEWLECSAMKNSEKVIFSDEQHNVTYGAFLSDSKRIGSSLSSEHILHKPVAVLMSRSTNALKAMFGTIYAGCFYTVLDADMPVERMKLICSRLHPSAIITEPELEETAESLGSDKVIAFTSAVECNIDEESLNKIRHNMIDTDPLYVLFTSGSTGVPKGVVINHINMISYINWFTECFNIGEDVSFGSQTPFYFSMSVTDIYSTIKSGGTLTIIPRKMFSFPVNLIKYMDLHYVNTIYWVPSALCILANLKVFDYIKPSYLKKVLFAGEQMPSSKLSYWINKIPDAEYANLFGPTETTDICTYYKVRNDMDENTQIPIGKACSNCNIFVLNSDNQLVDSDEEGELYVRGSFVSQGYYNDPVNTSKAFIQNPLNTSYPEPVYRTGDIVKYSDNGDLIFVSRKDFMIKHMGYRIELGEIESAVYKIDGVQSCVAVYNKDLDKIGLVYTGTEIPASDFLQLLKQYLPYYMIPSRIERIDAMPLNPSGKTDRKSAYKIVF